MRKRLDVRLPEALDARLRAAAAAQDRTVTWVVERALEAALGGSSGHEAGAAKRAPASPRARGRKDEPVDLMVALKASLDAAKSDETPVVQAATVTTADIVTQEAASMCDSCRRLGPPKSRPCAKCGRQRASNDRKGSATCPPSHGAPRKKP